MTRHAQVLVAAFLVSLLLGAAFLADIVSADVTSVADFTRDPTAVAGVPWWTGAISRLTALGWVTAAAGAILAGRHAGSDQRPRLLFLGGLCGVSALDDSLLLHEEVLPSLGLPEGAFLVLYAVAGLVLGVVWVRSHQWTLIERAFFAGAVMLAASVVVNASFNQAIVEDIAKVIGVVAWAFCGFWAHDDVCRGPRLHERTP